ncbi:adenosylmethionine--8-amino-7-oxononanoate transaminase [Thalassotalea sp. LPB0316]|uniref:adenosylmethionine--8-amino-7-oxononanoate transaminase n=1 Tax=Thalassotalea sp. LPB0316 TaxID=2769490 RepID=UPI0018679262|nr:adenosylmethionine--8-amino-7-oxononanoate transaminase [Thalassotalea sp. LPB0316]QOL24844.1 adenosylmethionine--8-amino-7-oxononanoate transaminase [Thalassotalea sp. LPB0316]
MSNKYTDLIEFDKNHIWHPYTSMTDPLPSYFVTQANGVELTIADQKQVIDGMSSWWAVIHGYNHPALNQALVGQSHKMSHVMFGGITHESAIKVSQQLISITPPNLTKVFISDSGSVSVEVAIKMAIQYWHAQNKPEKSKLLTVRNGYHGDTFAAMSVCDPVNGMHSIFEKVLAKNLFAPAPKTRFDQPWDESDSNALKAYFEQYHNEIAAFIIEPVVQGAGGMRIYHPNYLKAAKALCDEYNVLFIADEIATGFGRTGKLFACEWADIEPDILCLGKALTGGYMSLAATLTTDKVANTISQGDAGCFMHGPTFMANPLACSVANASLTLLNQNDWQRQVQNIERILKENLLPLASHERVQDTRVLGAIGVVEAKQAVNVAAIQKHFVDMGVWIRPFGKLIYIMPPYIINQQQLNSLIDAIASALDKEDCFV